MEFQEDCGDSLTWKILTDNMNVIPRSNVRSAVNPTDANLCLDPTGGESNPKPICFIKDRRDLDESSPVGFMPMQGFDPADLI